MSGTKYFLNLPQGFMTKNVEIYIVVTKHIWGCGFGYSRHAGGVGNGAPSLAGFSFSDLQPHAKPADPDAAQLRPLQADAGKSPRPVGELPSDQHQPLYPRQYDGAERPV